jgi:hypothetical protein
MENMPATLEGKLKTYENSLAYDGYSAEELRNNVSGFVPKKSLQFKINGKLTPKKPSEDIYFYFNKSENSVDIPVGTYAGYIPLQNEKYGFSGETSRLNPNKAEGLNLNNASRERYEALTSKQETTLPEILETVGSVVNSSMRYDFDKIIEKEKSLGHVSDWGEAKSKYTPTGEEVSQGVCFDAGKQIRNILYNLGMDSKYKIKHVSSSKNGFMHDTTLVFNEESGAWGVINSKSPTKEFNFATKEQLEKLGHPYHKK